MHVHLFAFLLAHSPAHQVRLSQRVPRELLRQLHNLLLIHHDSVGVAENLFHLRNQISDALFSQMTLNKIVHHPAVQGTRTIKCVKCGEIFNALGLELAADFLHSGRLKLKDRISTPLGKDSHRLLVVKRYIGPVNLNSKQLFNAQ